MLDGSADPSVSTAASGSASDTSIDGCSRTSASSLTSPELGIREHSVSNFGDGGCSRVGSAAQVWRSGRYQAALDSASEEPVASVPKSTRSGCEAPGLSGGSPDTAGSATEA